MPEFRMPSLGADMDAGTVLEWRVGPGDEVHRGDILAVVQTDKADIEVESFHDGILDELLVPEGQRVVVGTPLARIGEPIPAATPATSPITSPLTRHLATRHGIDLHAIAGSGPGGSITRSDVERAIAQARPQATRPSEAVSPRRNGQRGPLATPPTRRRASPRARRLAAEVGIDLQEMEGSGPHGALTGDDVVRHAALPAPASRVSPAALPSVAASPDERLAAQRRAIGELMARSKREIPHYYLSTDIELSAVLDLLATRNQDRPPQNRLLPAAFLLKAVARATIEVPGFNGHWHPQDGFVPADRVQLGVAIALREGGLIAPTLSDANQRDLDDLMTALRDLVARARTGRLRGSELSNATVTVTNLGDRGAPVVYGVIVPPQVAIIGVGRIENRPRVIAGPDGDNRIEARPVVTVTLSADHRVTTGHEGGRLLDRISTLLQTPEEL